MIVLLPISAALASPAELYGFGARTMGRGQGGVAMPGDAGSAIRNPAALGGMQSSELLLGYTVVRFDFADIPPVYWDTNRDGRIDGTDTPLEVPGTADSGDGTMLGIARQITPYFGFGASLFIPRDRLLRLQTMDPSLPGYLMYQNRTQRYEAAIAIGGRPLPSLSLGAGVRLMSKSILDVSFTVDAAVSGEDTEDASVEDLTSVEVDVHELSFDLVPSMVPYAGVRWEPGVIWPKLEGLAVGATWRADGGIPVDVNLDGQVNVSAEDIGDLDPITLAILADVQVSIFDHYLPQQWVLGAAYAHDERLYLTADAHRTAWHRMQVNISELVDAEFNATLADLSGVEVADGNAVSGIEWRDTWGWNAGAEYYFGHRQLRGNLGWHDFALRAGMGYEPSPLVSQGPDTALLDADRLIFGGGAGLSHGAIWGLVEGPVTWDVFGQVHVLAQGELQRPAGREYREGYPVDGAAIPIGGRFYAAGLQMSYCY